MTSQFKKQEKGTLAVHWLNPLPFLTPMETTDKKYAEFEVLMFQ